MTDQGVAGHGVSRRGLLGLTLTILALTALIPSRDGNTADRFAGTRPMLVLIGIFGAALLYGDGMITPAISVLGATEGLKVISPPPTTNH